MAFTEDETFLMTSEETITTILDEGVFQRKPVENNNQGPKQIAQGYSVFPTHYSSTTHVHVIRKGCPNTNNLRSHGKIVEVEIGGVAIYRPFGEFRRVNSYCHLYGAQDLGQRQVYF
ncbi:UNVERIFIED_CONTAM: hypothetical protein NCL1_22039 [Trichonephila clavipes]